MLYVISLVFGICSACFAIEAIRVLPGGSREQILPPEDPPAHHIPAPAPKQTSKKDGQEIEQPPNEPAKPARRGQQGFLILSNGTTLYFDRKKKYTKVVKAKEIQKKQADILEAEYDEFYNNL